MPRFTPKFENCLHADVNAPDLSAARALLMQIAASNLMKPPTDPIVFAVRDDPNGCAICAVFSKAVVEDDKYWPGKNGGMLEFSAPADKSMHVVFHPTTSEDAEKFANLTRDEAKALLKECAAAKSNLFVFYKHDDTTISLAVPEAEILNDANWSD